MFYCIFARMQDSVDAHQKRIHSAIVRDSVTPRHAAITHTQRYRILHNADGILIHNRRCVRQSNLSNLDIQKSLSYEKKKK